MNNDKEQIKEVLIRMLNSVDSNKFERAKEQFTKIVFSDYSALNGVEGSEVDSSEMVEGWKLFLEPVTSSHMVSNIEVEINGDQAESYSHFYARHEFEEVPFWDVCGRYHNKYQRTQNGWKISSTKVILHGHRGNLNFYDDVQNALKL